MFRVPSVACLTLLFGLILLTVSVKGSLQSNAIPTQNTAIDIIFYAPTPYPGDSTITSFFTLVSRGLLNSFRFGINPSLRLALLCSGGCGTDVAWVNGTVHPEYEGNNEGIFAQIGSLSYGDTLTQATISARFAQAEHLFFDQPNVYLPSGTVSKRFFVLLTANTFPTAADLLFAQSAARALKFKGVTIITLQSTNQFIDSDALRSVTHDFQTLATKGHSFVTSSASPSFQLAPEYAPVIISKIRQNSGFKCLSFGAGHFSTFDGNFYDFQALGDFVLYAPLKATEKNLQIEIRKGLCKNAFGNDPSSQKKVSCNRGVAVSYDGNIFNFFVENSLDGGSLPIVNILTGTNIAGNPTVRTLNSGSSTILGATIYAGVRGNTYLVYFKPQPTTVYTYNPFEIIMEFSNDGIAVSFRADATLNAQTSGLCGFYNGDPSDDFRNAKGVTIPTGTSNSDLDGLFGETFRSHASTSIFFQGTTGNFRFEYNAFFNTWKGDYGTSGSGDCGSIPISSGLGGSFLRDTCNDDAGAGFPSDVALRVFRQLCYEYCEIGAVTSSLISANECEESFCTWRDSETRLDLHTRYTSLNPPPYQLTASNDPRILFRPTLNLGGRYDLQLRIDDFCGHEFKNLSINVICSQTLVPTVTVVTGLNSYFPGFGPSQVILRADVAGSSLPLSYSWEILAYPTSGSEPDRRPNSISRTLVLGNYFPYLGNEYTGNSLVPGLYTVELAVTDGCSIERTIFSFNASCSNCSPKVDINADAKPSYFLGTNFQAVTITSTARDDDQSTPKLDWFMSELPDSPYHFKRIDSTTGATKTYVRYIPASSTVTYLPTVTTSATGYNTTYTFSSNPNYIARSIANSNILERFYRSNYASSVNTYELQTITTIDAVFLNVSEKIICVYTLSGSSTTAVVTPSVVALTPEGIEACRGKFLLNLTAYDECPTHNTTDGVIFEVTCSVPVARLKCHESTLNYSYSLRKYPNFVLDARDTYDTITGNDLTGVTFLYEGMDHVICGNGTVPCRLGGGIGASAMTLSVNPNLLPNLPRFGSSSNNIRLTVSNGCNSSYDYITVTLLCPTSESIAVHANFGDLDYPPVDYDYVNNNPINNVFNASSSGYPLDVTNPRYVWSLEVDTNPPVKVFPTDGEYTRYGVSSLPSMVPTVTIVGPVTFYNNLVPGNHKLRVSVDIGCGAFTSSQVAAHITCVNQIDLSSLPSSISITYGDTTPVVYSTGTATSTVTTIPVVTSYPRFIFGYWPSSVPGFSSISYAANDLTFTQALASVHLSETVLKGDLWVHDTHCAWATKPFEVHVSCPTKVLTNFKNNLWTEHFDSYTSNIFRVAYHLDYLWYGNEPIPLVSSAGGFRAVVRGPYGSIYYPSQTFTTNATVLPDVEGTYLVDMWFNDGCGDNYTDVITSFALTPTCPTIFSSSLTAVADPNTDISFDDKQTVRLSITPPTWAAGYDFGVISSVAWTVISAPNNSVYYATNKVVEFAVNSTTVLTNFSSSINETTMRNMTTLSHWVQSTSTVVNLELSTDNDLSVWSSCFRPDVGGTFVVQFAVYLIGYTACPLLKTTSTIKVGCGASPIIPLESAISVPVAREKPTRVWLNANSVFDPDTANESLTFNWDVIYPVSGDLSPIDGSALTIPDIVSPRSRIASFMVPQANIAYIVRLTVSDECTTVTKLITIKTPCSLVIPLENKTLATTYDGQVPVTLMSFAYDHTQEISDYLTYPKCQTYSWSLVDYSVTIADAALSNGSTEFVKTSGFAGLISVVVVVAVVVPVVIWMYVTKKACFSSTDPRV